MDENLIWISSFFRVVTIFGRVRHRHLRCFFVLLLLPATATALAFPRFFGRGGGVVGVGNDAAILVGKRLRGHRWRVLQNRESRLTTEFSWRDYNESEWRKVRDRRRRRKWINNNLVPTVIEPGHVQRWDIWAFWALTLGSGEKYIPIKAFRSCTPYSFCTSTNLKVFF